MSNVCISLNLTDSNAASEWALSDMDQYLLRFIVPLMGALGIVGNAAFLFMIIRLKTMRTSLSAYLANLAVADIMFLIVYNGWVAAPVTQKIVESYPVDSKFGCAIWPVIIFLWYVLSVGLMTIITMERYYAVCKPMEHMKVVSKSRTIKTLVALWVGAIMLSLLTIPRFARPTRYCFIWPDTDDFDNLPAQALRCQTLSRFSTAFVDSLALIMFIFPLIANCVLYMKIIKVLGKRPQQTTNSTAIHSNEAVLRRPHSVRNQVTRTLIVNGIIFFICQLPYRVYVTDEFLNAAVGIKLFAMKYENNIEGIGVALLLINSVINPYLYVFSCRHYRQGMKKAFTTCSHRELAGQKSSISTWSKFNGIWGLIFRCRHLNNFTFFLK